MTVDVVAAVAAILLALVGLVGIVFPVLPGSIMVGVGALVWAIWGASVWGWVAFGVAAFLLVVGATSSLLLTGRGSEHSVLLLERCQLSPNWPVD